MKINKTIETNNGQVKFEGEVSQAELDMIMECGLNYLLLQGALPMMYQKQLKQEEELKIPKGTTLQ